MKLNRILATLTLLVIFSNANALKNDFEQPIYIEADNATFDEKKGESTYTGKVQVTQGSMRLKSDRLVVYTRDQKADKIIATGNPVRFRQTPEKGKKEIKGKSQRAEFYATQSRIILLDNAVVWQGKNTTTSDRIEYDYKNAIVKASKKSANSKRVHVTLQPEKREK